MVCRRFRFRALIWMVLVSAALLPAETREPTCTFYAYRMLSYRWANNANLPAVLYENLEDIPVLLVYDAERDAIIGREFLDPLYDSDGRAAFLHGHLIFGENDEWLKIGFDANYGDTLSQYLFDIQNRSIAYTYRPDAGVRDAWPEDATSKLLRRAPDSRLGILEYSARGYSAEQWSEEGRRANHPPEPSRYTAEELEIEVTSITYLYKTEEPRAYRMDPTTRQAEVVPRDVWLPNIYRLSADGRFYVRFEGTELETTPERYHNITVYRAIVY